MKGIEEQNAEIKAIVDNPEEPTFEDVYKRQISGSCCIKYREPGYDMPYIR